MKRILALTAALISLLVTATTTASPAHAAPHKEHTLRVLSFNIHHAADADDVLDPERIARDIERSGADVIGLQEVDNHWGARSAFADQAAWLADRLGMHVAYGANLDLAPAAGQTERRQYGTAILSRFPILEAENHRLTSIQYPTRPTEQRGLLSVTINVRGLRVDVHNTHLDHQRAEQRASQVREILALTKSDRPTILTGDLNAVPSSPEMRDLMTAYTDTFAALGQDDAYTYPVENPDRRIDYILVRGDARPLSAHVIPSQASDHLPVVADVRVSGKPGNA
ncbi:endonuclease/exonuclease/phosphatase family protein [Mariniluteicoccus flavus]